MVRIRKLHHRKNKGTKLKVEISCIVEGYGEVEAVPKLVHRIAEDYLTMTVKQELVIVIPPPIRVKRTQVVKVGELERKVELAARKINGQGAILIILDSEDDCPAELGPSLLHRASQVRQNLPIAVVLAKYEFESWFLAAAESLRRQRELKDDIDPPKDPEAIRDAKGWLSQQMEGSRRYRERAISPHSQHSLTSNKLVKLIRLTSATETLFGSLKKYKNKEQQLKSHKSETYQTLPPNMENI